MYFVDSTLGMCRQAINVEEKNTNMPGKDTPPTAIGKQWCVLQIRHMG